MSNVQKDVLTQGITAKNLQQTYEAHIEAYRKYKTEKAKQAAIPKELMGERIEA